MEIHKKQKVMLKQFLKILLPSRILKYIVSKRNSFAVKRQLKRALLYDANRIIQFSETNGQNTHQQLISLIIREYHVIEKGLTMPSIKFGFGRDVIIDLIRNILIFDQKYGNCDVQLHHAVSVVLEYDYFHQINNFKLSTDLSDLIKHLKVRFTHLKPSSQKNVTLEDYFSSSQKEFLSFSSSRASVRNYSNVQVDVQLIYNALELARNTPSSCNRQPWRTYIFENRDTINLILKTQGGNRGFGHLTNKLIIIAVEMGVYTAVSERHSAYVDGGMYAMNILYALHHYKVAACILNCSNTIDKDLELRLLCKIKESEVFIAMLSCGIPPSSFRIAQSFRYPIEFTNNHIF